MYQSPKLNLTDPMAGFSGYNLPGFGTTPKQSTAPTVDLYLSMGLSSLGNVLTTIGQVSASRAKGAYEAGIARTNATIARIQARQVLEAGDFVAARKNVETKSVVGAVRAQQGASGVDVNSGSSVLVRNAIAGAGAMDELTIKTNAARQAWGLETDALESTYKGQYAKMTARNEAEQTILSGGLSAMSGPLGIYRRSKVYGSGGTTSRLPFNLETN